MTLFLYYSPKSGPLQLHNVHLFFSIARKSERGFFSLANTTLWEYLFICANCPQIATPDTIVMKLPIVTRKNTASTMEKVSETWGLPVFTRGGIFPLTWHPMGDFLKGSKFILSINLDESFFAFLVCYYIA
jgi:hypothetical protein